MTVYCLRTLSVENLYLTRVLQCPHVKFQLQDDSLMFGLARMA